ncbi:hypothetical protein Taro_019340 [Colocasia esculenta]|uniref:Uncharacterized protein n=1 Tax=Colocasia esculenta TaxID=4460 RepID=A0A843UW33_COLES|nr:hypothetical protein [Colocasia esculenta]
MGGGSWIVGARRWRVASLREGLLRLDLHLEGCAGLGVAVLKATPGLPPSQPEKGLGNLLSVLLPLRLGETSQQFPPRLSEETGPQ